MPPPDIAAGAARGLAGGLWSRGSSLAPSCGHAAQMRSRRGVCAVRSDVGRPVGGAGVSRPLIRAAASAILAAGALSSRLRSHLYGATGLFLRTAG